MSESSEKHMLRFGCPGCGTRLVVDPSLAGTEGPCPSCGDIIIAPPIAAATSLVAKAAPAVVVQPREVSRKQVEMSTSAPTAEQKERRRGRGTHGPAAMASPARLAGTSGSATVSGSAGSRPVAPKSSVSEPETQSKDVKTLLIMLLITILVVCIALGVYYYMTMQG